jgi:hypothetical protein
MFSKIKYFAARHQTLTYVIVFALGGILTLSFGFLAKIFAVPAGAVKGIADKVTPSTS